MTQLYTIRRLSWIRDVRDGSLIWTAHVLGVPRFEIYFDRVLQSSALYDFGAEETLALPNVDAGKEAAQRIFEFSIGEHLEKVKQ